MRDLLSVARALLGADTEIVEPLVEFADRASFRARRCGEDYVVKTDDDERTTRNEIAGQQRAAAAGIRVPELVATADHALAMRWVDGLPLSRHPTAAAWRDAGAQMRLMHDVGGGPPFGAGFGGYDDALPDWRSFFELFADTMLGDCERGLGLPLAQGDAIRAELYAADLDTPEVVWCHGDLQPEHVLVDPASDRVTAIIDWSDHGAGDFVWDVAVLTLDATPVDALLDGYRVTREQRVALDVWLPLYSVVRLAGEAVWLADHGFPHADNLRRVREWRG